MHYFEERIHNIELNMLNITYNTLVTVSEILKLY